MGFGLNVKIVEKCITELRHLWPLYNYRERLVQGAPQLGCLAAVNVTLLVILHQPPQCKPTAVSYR